MHAPATMSIIIITNHIVFSPLSIVDECQQVENEARGARDAEDRECDREHHEQRNENDAHFPHLPSIELPDYRHYNEFDGGTAFKRTHEAYATGNETHIDLLETELFNEIGYIAD